MCVDTGYPLVPFCVPAYTRLLLTCVPQYRNDTALLLQLRAMDVINGRPTDCGNVMSQSSPFSFFSVVRLVRLCM